MRQAVCAAVCGCVLAVLGIAPGAAAQPCAPTPTGVFVEWSACNNGPRINWTLPGGQLIFPRVYRSLTPNVADATLAVQGSLNEQSEIDSGAPANVDVYYWVQFEGLNASCQFSALSGPVLGRRISLGSTTNVVPAPQATLQCSGVRLDWPRIRENAGQSILVRRYALSPNEQVDFPLPPGTTTFTDTSGVSGRRYLYNVFFLNTCRGTEATDAVVVERFPPSAGVAIPVGAESIAGQAATISVSASGFSPSVQSVQWFKGASTTPITLDSRVQAQGMSLTFNPVLESDAGLYRARPVWACGNQAAVEVGLVVHRGCRADHNGSGGVSVQDVFDFLTDFFNACP